MDRSLTMRMSMNYRKLIISFSFFISIDGAMVHQEILKSQVPALEWGLSARQGDRPYMEDAYHVSVTNSKAFFGIFDGHGGKEAANYAAKYLQANIERSIKENDIIAGIVKGFEITDKQILNSGVKSGTTAIIASIVGDKLYLAWVGDSWATVIRNDSIIYATEDHKPDYAAEKKRIESVGGHVSLEGVWRINGLAVSRALGDKPIKDATPGAVISAPSVHTLTIKPGDIIIVACDGLEDKNISLFADELFAKSDINFLEKLPQKPFLRGSKQKDIAHEEHNNNRAQLIARAMRDQAYGTGSFDNITVIAIRVVNFTTSEKNVRSYKQP